MNASSRKTLLAVGACAVGVAAALGWATSHALRLERRELEAQSRAQFQTAIRVALWRMDAALTPIVARETARPYFHYNAFYPSERGYTAMLEDVEPGEHLVPSPLLTMDQQFVRLYFQRSATGEITSPQVPRGSVRDLVESSLVGSERVLEAETRLAELGRILAGSGRTPLAAAEMGERLKKRSEEEIGRANSEREATALSYKEPQKSAPTAVQQIAQGNDELSREFDARQQFAGNAAQLEKQANSVGKRLAPRRGDGKEAAPIGGAAKGDLAKESERASAGRDVPGEARARKIMPAPAAPAPIAAVPATEAVPAAISPPVDKDTADKQGAAAKAETGSRAAGDTALGARLDEAKRGVAGDASLKGADIDDSKHAAGVDQGDMAPTWRVVNGSGEPQLMLVRTVRVGETRFEQGCWLDWPALKAWLASNVQDLLPGATLVPVTDPYAQADPEALGRRLAGVSAELEAGAAPVLSAPGWTPMRTTLVFTWGAVVLSFGAIGAALMAARELAERRGQFVSAVTHELRTPLTTFCLYSQMLADGMVTEEGAKREYLGTLRRESDRLTKIVENVLEYARVGRAGKGAAERRVVRVSELIERVVPSLRERAVQIGVALEVTDLVNGGLAEVAVEVNPVSVERVLANLVDNACKYAPGSPITLSVREAGRDVEFSVADAGPGIPGEQRAMLFQPFERGRSLAHATTPGLGLGLALSRTLARRMGGDLKLTNSSDRGSVFTLRVPKAAPDGLG